MSTDYFVLSKPAAQDVSKEDETQTVCFGHSRDVFVLPRVNMEYYTKNGLFEKHLIDWCRQFCSKDRVFLDIGAHTGTFAIPLAHHSICVHAFEPQTATYNALCGGIALSNLSHKVFAHKCGLGSDEQVGRQVLRIISHDGGGSTLHHFGDKDPVLSEEMVTIRTLDSFGLENVGFMKLDVEDNEVYVLRGATETLEKSGYPPFVFESNRENGELFGYIKDTLRYNIVSIRGCVNMYLACKP